MACLQYQITNGSAILPATPIGFDCELNPIPTIPPSGTIFVCSYGTPGQVPGEFIILTVLGDCPGTPTQTPTGTPEQTQTPSQTSTQTPTPSTTAPSTPTQTQTPTHTPTQTRTPRPTTTPTQTPTSTKVNCGQGVTNQYFNYFDCCGVLVSGQGAGQSVVLDYTKPFAGVTLLNVPATQICVTPTSTGTPTQTPTNTATPTITPTNTGTPSPTPTKTPITTCSGVPEYENECEVFTLFDMGVSCNLIKEPTRGGFDGIMSVNITGGTAPYSFYWNTGERTQTISNIPYGTYTVLVVDYYGDYSATTSCSILAPTPTMTPTQTLTQTPTATLPLPNLCLRFVALPSFGTSGGSSSYQQLPLTFVPSGSQNGKPTWYNTSNNLTIVWNNSVTPNRWQINSWSLGGTPISTNQGLIPDSDWSFIGTPATYTLINSTRGSCPVIPPLSFTYQITRATCPNVCNGGLTILPVGGVPPYTYSINGTTFQSSNIFTNLCPSSFGLTIRDAVGTNFQQPITIPGGSNTVFTIGPVIVASAPVSSTPSTRTVDWVISISPTLPVGVTVVGDVIFNITQVEQGPTNSAGPATVYSINANNTVYLNNTLQSLITNTPTSQSVLSTCNSALVSATAENYTERVIVNLSAGFSLSGRTVSVLNISNPSLQNNCVSTARQTIRMSLNNFRILGDPCYSIEFSDLTLIDNHTYTPNVSS